MDEQENITSLEESDEESNEAITSDEDGGKAESSGLKDKIGGALGKEFKSDEAALKAVQDTFKYVGKVKTLSETMTKIQKQLNTDEDGVIAKLQDLKDDSSKYVPREDFEKMQFYQDKAEFKPYQKMIETYRKANPDKSRDEIVEGDDFKEIFEKAKAHDESENKKSVLKTSSKLGGITDKLSDSREALSKGNIQKAERDAVDAVLEAFPVE